MLGRFLESISRSSAMFNSQIFQPGREAHEVREELPMSGKQEQRWLENICKAVSEFHRLSWFCGKDNW